MEENMTAPTIIVLIHVALTALSQTSACGFVKNTNIIYAGSFVIEEGERLFLNCTLPLNAVECFSITDIKCRLEGSRFRVVNRVFVLSQETTQLWLQIVTRNQSGGFSCQIPIDNKRNLSRCNSRSFILNGRLDVLRRPLKPVITSCAIRNWTRVQCRWGPTQKTQLQHGYLKNGRFLHQTISVQSHENSSQWRPVCTNSVNETCDWLLNDSYHNNDQSSQSPFGRSRCVQVTVSNGYLPGKSVNSDPYCFKVEDTVTLDPPTDVSAVVTKSGASLKWSPPYVDPGYKDSLLFKVRYHSEWQDDDSGWLEVFSKTSQVLLRSLHPNTIYAVDIQAATSVGRVWSQSLSASFRTSPSVPCSHAKVSSSGFFIRSSNETHRNVTLYWKAIPKSDECGPHLVYKLKVNSTNAECFSFELQNETSVDVALSNRAAFAVHVLARNAFGFASQPTASTVIVIPTLESTVNEEEIQEALQAMVEGNQSTVTVHWNHRTSFRQVVIYWCQRHADANQLCQDEIHWSDRPSMDGQFELLLAGHFDSYLIGLAANLDNSRTSGIHWFKCVYDIEKALDPPQIIEVKAAVDSTDQLMVTWSSSQCHEERYISSYLLLYCMYTNDVCSELRGVNLSSASFEFQLTGLEENSRYEVWIESVSDKRGPSRSLPKDARTNAKKFTQEPVLDSGAVGGLVVGCIILTVAGSIILLILLPKSRDSLCLEKIHIDTPPQYGESEFHGYTSNSQQSELLNDYDNDKMTLTADSSLQLNYPPPSITTDKKQPSQIKKIRKYPPRSESEDQSECEYFLVGGSKRISSQQHLYGSASVLPVLPNDTGRTLPSCNISRDSEQLVDTDNKVFDLSVHCISTANEVKPMPINNSKYSSLHVSILPKILQKTNSKSTAINTDSITSTSPKMSHGPCSKDVTEAQTRSSKRMRNLGKEKQRVDAAGIHRLPKPVTYDVSTHEILMPVRNSLRADCDFPVSPKRPRSILPPCEQFETTKSPKEVAIAVPQTWADVNSASDGEYTTGQVIVTNFFQVTEAAAVHQNCANSTFTADDDGYTSGRVNFTG